MSQGTLYLLFAYAVRTSFGSSLSSHRRNCTTFDGCFSPTSFRLTEKAKQACCVPKAALALTRGVSETLPYGLISPTETSNSISLHVLKAQHAAYEAVISNAPGIRKLIRVPTEPSLPDAVFVEDPVILLSRNIALFPQAGHPSRAPEATTIRETLSSLGIRAIDGQFRLDGGDVIFGPLGLIFVGISERTDDDATEHLQRILNNSASLTLKRKVIPVRVNKGLHLKSAISWVGYSHERTLPGEGFFVTLDAPYVRSSFQKISEAICKEADMRDLNESERMVEVAYVSERDSHAANVLFLPGKENSCGEQVLVQSRSTCTVENVSPRFSKRFPTGRVVAVDTSEFAKANGALTCMSVIIPE